MPSLASIKGRRSQKDESLLRHMNYIDNANNRLVTVEDELTKTIIAEHGYDPFGRRLWKEVQGVRTYFLYADEGLIAEFDAQGNELRSYGWQPDSIWGTNPLWLKQNGQYYFYQNDHLGTPQKLVAMNGSVVWSAQYEAFGNAHVDIETVANNLRFPGQYFDAETGLHYNFQRYYDPLTGRYVSADPIGFDGGDVNLYKYASNDPTTYIDPRGLKEYKFDKEKCILEVTLIWTIKFVNDYSGNWSEREKESWRSVAEGEVESYFNNSGFRCYPILQSCCTCKDGVNITFDLQFSDKKFFSYHDVVVSVEYDNSRYRSRSWAQLPIESSGAHTTKAGLDRGDINAEPKGGDMPQTAILHETGHMLGLQHPGHYWPHNIRPIPNSLQDYMVDKNSLMGAGNELRPQDFMRAFCKHIKSEKNCEPWRTLPPIR